MRDYFFFKELQPVDLPLDYLYLNPDHPGVLLTNWKYIPDSKIDDIVIQKEVQKLLEDGGLVAKIIENMKIYGFLSMNRVIVRKFADEKYVVLDDNPRICAAKFLLRKYEENHASVAEEVIQSFGAIPCLLYTGTETDVSFLMNTVSQYFAIK